MLASFDAWSSRRINDTSSRSKTVHKGKGALECLMATRNKSVMLSGGTDGIVKVKQRALFFNVELFYFEF